MAERTCAILVPGGHERPGHEAAPWLDDERKDKQEKNVWYDRNSTLHALFKLDGAAGDPACGPLC
jgi:hypothetical protein